jgi:NADP-dependent 3-hydroxy acid dehydrogenase YdfG
MTADTSAAAPRPVAVITGASSGIGAASARALARHGFRPVLGARRADRVREVAAEIGGLGSELDVTDAASIESFMALVERECGRIDLLVNNAGLALGIDPIDSIDDQDVVRMWETNVLGLLRVTRAALPLVRRSPAGHVINIGSVAGFDNYRGGAGYTATKHAVRAITQTLRLELNGEPIRVTEIAPGMTETEFGLVRFKGDGERAAAAYAGLTPLTPDDIAECLAFAATRPPHVDIDYLVVRPVAQAASWLVARNQG